MYLYTAAYDTVNHNVLLHKIYYHTKDWDFVQIVAPKQLSFYGDTDR